MANNEEENEEIVVGVDTAKGNSDSNESGDGARHIFKIVENRAEEYSEDIGIKKEEIDFDSGRNVLCLYGLMADPKSGKGSLFFYPVNKQNVLIAAGIDPELDYPREESHYYDIYFNEEQIDRLHIERLDKQTAGMSLQEFGSWYNDIVDEIKNK